MIKPNNKYGQMVVIRETIKNGKKCWECRCKCGKLCYPTTYCLLKRKYKSCGCLRLKAITRSYKNISGVWFGQNKKNARIRNLKFDLSIRYLNNLLIKQDFKCALSNVKIKIIQGRRSPKTTASLDRIDSSKGYIKGNVQFVHKYVNLMKQDFKQDEFIQLCKLVYENSKKHE